MSLTDVQSKAARRKNGAEEASLEAFVLDIVDLASSVDHELADILCDGHAPNAAKKPWTGGRRRGLELCLSMLGYAREEVARGEPAARLDHAEAHVRYELAKIYAVEGRHVN